MLDLRKGWTLKENKDDDKQGLTKDKCLRGYEPTQTRESFVTVWLDPKSQTQ